MTYIVQAASGRIDSVERQGDDVFVNVTAVRSSEPLKWRKGGKADGEVVAEHHAPVAVLQDRVERWAGRPVTLNHAKKKDGRVRLVDDRDMARLTNSPAVGEIIAASVDEGDLKFRIKVDEAEVQRRGHRLEDLETSVSAVQAPFKTRGDGSKEWTRIILPDSLALLTDQVGACSNADGCGLHLQAAGAGECGGSCDCDSCSPGGSHPVTKPKDGDGGDGGTKPTEPTEPKNDEGVKLSDLTPTALMGFLKKAGVDLAALAKDALKEAADGAGDGGGTPDPEPTQAGAGSGKGGDGPEIPEGMKLVEADKLARFESMATKFEAMENEQKKEYADRLIACSAYTEEERDSLMATPLDDLRNLEERFAKVAPKKRPALTVVGAGSNLQGKPAGGDSPVIVPPSLDKIRERQAAGAGGS